MKRIIVISVLFILSCSSLFADNDSGKKKNTDWFVGAGGGFNMALDGTKVSGRKDSHIGAGTALDVYFGKFFNNVIGFRAGYHGLTTSNQFRSYGKDNFNYVHADLLFRPSDYVLPYVHLDLGLDNFKYFTGGAGVMFQIPVGKRIQIVPDVKAALFSADVFDIPENKCAVNISATIGIKFSFGKKARRTKAVEEPAMGPAVEVASAEPAAEPVELSKVDTAMTDASAVRKDTVIIYNLSECPSELLVFFKLNKATIDSTQVSHLHSFVNYVKRCIAQNGKVRLIGASDKNTGSHDYNFRLGYERANFVKSVLVTKYGIEAEAIEVVSEGDSNNRFEIPAMNRCVYVTQ